MDAIVVFSIPANPYISRFLVGHSGVCWELTRLWAPDGHDKNLLTRAIADSVHQFRRDEPGVEVLVSYADPNVGHAGGVYRAASWLYTGQAEESRYYLDANGQVVARRRFHSGGHSLKKSDILALGYREVQRPGRHRFARGLSRSARKILAAKWGTHAT